jgi:hypothetical protein
MKTLIFKAPCPVCRKVVFHAKADGAMVEYFEVKEIKMLVIVATPEIDGKKRISLGPCQSKEPFHREDEEPVIYFAHPKHGCLPPPVPSDVNRMDTSTGTVSNRGDLAEPLSFPGVIPGTVPAPTDPLKVSKGER